MGKSAEVRKKHSPDSKGYKLGQFYKDEIEKLEGSEVNQQKIDKLIQNAKKDLTRHQGEEPVTEMLLSVVSFLETLKLFA